jgi:hypothetical protein
VSWPADPVPQQEAVAEVPQQDSMVNELVLPETPSWGFMTARAASA